MNQKIIKKGNIFIVLYPEWSSFNATLMLSRELCNRGYQVIYAGPPRFERYVVENGFQYLVYNIVDLYQQVIKKNMGNYRGNKKKIGRLRLFLLKVRMKKKAIQEVFLGMEEYLAGCSPDLVLLDPFMVNFSIPFLRLKIPIMNLSFLLYSFPSLDVPPEYSGIIPGYKSGWLSRCKNLAAWLRILSWQIFVDGFYRNVLHRFNFNIPSYHSLKREVKKCGVRLRRSEVWLKLELPELVTCPREFDFPLISGVTPRCYMGASVSPDRKQAGFDWQGIDKGKSILYCTLGSYNRIWKHRKRLYYSVIETVRDLPGWQLIVQMSDEDRKELAPFPVNVFVAQWLPQMEILSHTSIIICHGGFGTVREAVYSGVPMIIFPCERDQPGISARVVFHHLGVRGNIKKVTPRVVRSLIDQISHDGLIRRSVEEMQRVFREQMDGNRGCDFIETFLSKQSEKREKQAGE